MLNWKILIADGLGESGQSVLRASAQVDDRSDIAADELLERISMYDALIVRSRTSVTREVIEKGEKIKVIGRAGVGVDNIDLEAAQDHNVKVVNTPTSASQAVAELTLGLMLAMARRILHADFSMKTGKWEKNQLRGIELGGKTLGVIGMGNIGAAVTRRAAAFGMSVVGYDPALTEDEIASRAAKPVSLNELYTQADFISLHVPFTTKTHGMIDGRALGQMKPGVRLICTARGGVIDESALLDALDTGQVAGAALDVFSQEPPGQIPLVTHRNVIATPHIGAQTIEAQRRAGEDIAREVLAALCGDPLRWQVT